jgi:hypothetical protein
MGNEASGAHGEVFEILDGTPTEIALSATPGTYAKWVSGSQGLIGPSGLVKFEANDLDTWSALTRYLVGSKVSHGGHDWISIEADLDAWDIDTAYAADALVTKGGEDYVSLAADNVGHDPAESGSDWWALGNLDQEPTEESTYWTDSGERGDRLVIQEGGAGTYRIFANISAEGDPPTTFTWGVHKNNALVLQMLSSAVAVEGIRYPLTITGLIRLLPGDVLELAVAGSAGSETVIIHCLEFSIERISKE